MKSRIPLQHQAKLHSNDPLERVIGEINHRTKLVVPEFPGREQCNKRRATA
jgi:hypothetical protein